MTFLESATFKRRVTVYIAFAGSLFLLVFGLNAIILNNNLLGFTLLGLMLLGLTSLILMLLTDNTSIGQHGISIITFVLISYLIFTGGNNGTGPVWGYPLLIIFLILQGFINGLLGLALLFLLISVIFYAGIDDSYIYPEDFKVRYLATFLAVSVMVLIYEYNREKIEQNSLIRQKILEKNSTLDPLTNLLNRRAAVLELGRAFNAYERHESVFSIIMLDLDHFKELNDTYGHSVGDKVLIKTANLLLQHTRLDDYVVRWGGEEFIILLPNTALKEAYISAENLRIKLSKLDIETGDLKLNITASFGLASIKNCNSLDELIIQADKKLYEAKKAGRNTVKM